MRYPPIRDPDLTPAFDAALRERDLNPDDPWIGGYVEYEWNHVRYLFEASGIDFAGRRVLEFGCNYGATAIVLAQLGAQVTALDIDPAQVEIARLNAAQYGLLPQIGFEHIGDSTALPYPPGSFDIVVCNSVFEYVKVDQLPKVQQELDRVLAAGGVVFVVGTSNRLAAREVHSRRWFVNYLPAALDRHLARGGTLQRGLWPVPVRDGFGRHYRNLDLGDGANCYLRARSLMGAGRLRLGLLAAAAAVAHAFGWSVGMLTPSLCLRLQKTRHEPPDNCVP